MKPMANKGRPMAQAATDSGPKPGDFPLGSEKSRAAARAMLAAREEAFDDTQVFVVSRMDRTLALGVDDCLQILRESGHLRSGEGFALVPLCDIPDGLNAVELKRFLRPKDSESPPRNPVTLW
jgi:hypothetical protein